MFNAQVWGTVAAWTGSIGTITGLIGVAAQVNRARRVTYGQFVHELDKDYRGYFQVYTGALIGTENPTEEVTKSAERSIKILEQVAFFEKVKILLNQKVIKMSTIDTMFSGRFFDLAHSEETHRVLKANEDHVFTFFAMHAQWMAYRNKKILLIPSPEQNLAKSQLFAGNKYEELVKKGNSLNR